MINKHSILPVSFGNSTEEANYSKRLSKSIKRKRFEDVLFTRKIAFLDTSSKLDWFGKSVDLNSEEHLRSRGMLISTHYPYYSIEFPLNPEEITSSKTPHWVEINKVGQQSSGLIWTGSMSEKVRFDIRYDKNIMNLDIEKEIWKYKVFNEPHDFLFEDGSINLTPYLVAPPRAVFVWGERSGKLRELDVYVTIGDITQEFAGYTLYPIRATIPIELTIVDIMYSTRNRKHYKNMMATVYDSGFVKDPTRVA